VNFVVHDMMLESTTFRPSRGLTYKNIARGVHAILDLEKSSCCPVVLSACEDMSFKEMESLFQKFSMGRGNGNAGEKGAGLGTMERAQMPDVIRKLFAEWRKFRGI